MFAARSIIKQAVLALLCLSITAGEAAAANVLQLVIPAVIAKKLPLGPHWRTPQLLETDNAGNAQNPHVAVDAAGNAIAVWQQSDGTIDNIWASRYQAAGAVWSAPQLIETNNTDNAQNPQVVADAAGNAIAIWTQSGSNEHIMASRYDAGTDCWSTPQLISGTCVGWLWSLPEIAADAAGNAIVVWSQVAQPSLPWGAVKRIWSNRYAIDSSSWEGVQPIDAGSGYDVRNPCVAIESAGNHAVAVWSESDGNDSYFYARLRETGSNWGQAVRISDSVSVINTPKASIDAAGNVVTVWTEGYKMASLKAVRYEPKTGWHTPDVLIASSIDLTGPDLGMDANGNALLVLEQRSGMTYYIAASRYTAGGVGWSTPQFIENNSSYGVALAVHPAGSAMAVWVRTGSIYANRYVAKLGWRTPQLIETDPGTAGSPDIAIDAAGNAVAVWQQSDGTRNNIWAARYV